MSNTVTATRAQELMNQGALMIDVREPSEFAAEHIEGTQNLPLSAIATQKIDAKGKPVVFFCRSGARTQMNAAALSKIGGPTSVLMQGGISGWKAAGLPTKMDVMPKKGWFGFGR